MDEYKQLRALRYENIQAFLDGTRGQLTIGEIPPIRRAALAAEGKHVRVALIGRDNERVADLLQRLDATLEKFIVEGIVTDEVLPEIQRRRNAKRR